MSHRHVTWGHQNTCAAAVHWRKYINVTRNAAQAMSGRYLEIRYEDLISKPETSMAELEQFVTGAPAGSVTARFMSDAKQLKPEKIARWRETMSLRDQAIFDGVAADMLECCGYPLSGVGRPPSALRRVWYATHDHNPGNQMTKKGRPDISAIFAATGPTGECPLGADDMWRRSRQRELKP